MGLYIAYVQGLFTILSENTDPDEPIQQHASDGVSGAARMIISSILELVEEDPFRRIGPQETARRASELLSGYRAGALVVMADNILLGILSERDIVARLVAKGLSPEETQVTDIMTPNPDTITAEDSLAHAYQKMLDNKYRHLPVMEDGAVIGLIAIRNIPAEYRLMAERWAEKSKIE